MPKEGWLRRQFEKATEEVRDWPPWMRREMGLPMALIKDKREPRRGIAIGSISNGMFFEMDGKLCMKVHSMLIYCLSNNTQPAFKDTDIVMPVDVEIAIVGNLS